jgi:transposase
LTLLSNSVILVATMYVDTSHTGKYVRHLLRQNYREKDKVKHHTIANLSHCSEAEIDAIKLALKYKNDLSSLGSITETVKLKQGQSFGSVWVIYQIAKELGIDKALGNTPQGKLALWQVIARVIAQGSRLSAVRLASSHAACDILDMETFNEEDLYSNLDWLSEKQEKIEDSLYKNQYKKKKQPGLYLYDVTSSYLEGNCNELGAFGYNRDKKKGKKQIVIGLLCDEEGVPLSVQVFRGNTQDQKTVSEQIKKVSGRFGGKEVTLVGDRGMIKGQSIEELKEEGFHYITAITKPQIEKMLSERQLQMSLFDEDLAEVETKGIRYILRRNPIRAKEIRQIRQSKLEKLKEEIRKQNEYMKLHPGAKEGTSLKKMQTGISKLKIGKWASLTISGREIQITLDSEKLSEEEKLDGCYVLKTDISKEKASKEIIESRYKDLADVEWAFRTSKTCHLEMRPVHVRLESRTRGHIFVVMLAYRIALELSKRWVEVESTVEEAIDELKTVCAMNIVVGQKTLCNKIPEPGDSIKFLLKKAGVSLPETFPSKGIIVATRKKLVNKRLSH